MTDLVSPVRIDDEGDGSEYLDKVESQKYIYIYVVPERGASLFFGQSRQLFIV